MFEWVTETANKVSDWFSGGGQQQQQPKQSAPPAGGYQQQQQQLSPQNNTYEKQAQAQSPYSGTVTSGKGASTAGSAGAASFGGGLADWWSNLWGGGGEKKEQGGAGAPAAEKPQGESVADKRAREDKYYEAKWRLDAMKGNQSAYQRYLERRDTWDAAYAKYKQDPYKNKMPAQIQPYTAPNPGVIDPTHPAFASALAEQQAKVDQLKGG